MKQYFAAFKTSNIRLQNIHSVYLIISLPKKGKQTELWLLTCLRFPGRPFWFMIILIYWSSSLRMSIRILFSSLTMKNGIPIPSWWVTGLIPEAPNQTHNMLRAVVSCTVALAGSCSIPRRWQYSLALNSASNLNPSLTTKASASQDQTLWLSMAARCSHIINIASMSPGINLVCLLAMRRSYGDM